jgi:hypothetical protein
MRVFCLFASIAMKESLAGPPCLLRRYDTSRGCSSILPSTYLPRYVQLDNTFFFPMIHFFCNRLMAAAHLAEEFPFLVPQRAVGALSPRRAVQLVEAPPGKGSKFVFDPTGAVAAFLSRVSLPLKVIGVAGTFRSVSASPHSYSQERATFCSCIGSRRNSVAGFGVFAGNHGADGVNGVSGAVVLLVLAGVANPSLPAGRWVLWT